MQWKFWHRQRNVEKNLHSPMMSSVILIALLVVTFPLVRFLVGRIHPAASEVVILVASLLAVIVAVRRASLPSAMVMAGRFALWVMGVLLETVALTLDRAVGSIQWIVWVMVVLVFLTLLAPDRPRSQQ
ncbi:hypothetical protein HZA86_05290 [Candidatus Uhrbacteria bacterium]|nr:hypothetical protein [Candidatus Uhrbacteria bacterium]